MHTSERRWITSVEESSGSGGGVSLRSLRPSRYRLVGAPHGRADKKEAGEQSDASARPVLWLRAPICRPLLLGRGQKRSPRGLISPCVMTAKLEVFLSPDRPECRDDSTEPDRWNGYGFMTCNTSCYRIRSVCGVS